MGKRLRLGLQINSTDADYSRDLIEGISSWCTANDASLIIFSGRSFGWPYGYEYQNSAIYSHIHTGTIDAVIIITGTQCNFISKKELDDYLAARAPLPIVSVSIALDGIPSIVVDNDTGLRNLISHIIEVHGAKRIAVMKGPEDNSEAIQRLAIFRETLEAFGLENDSELEFFGDFSTEYTLISLKQYLKEHTLDFDALVCLNDNMALGAVHYFQEAGIRVPEDVIVTGFDDIHRSRYDVPSISTVSQDLVEQGRLAAEYAAALFEGREVPPCTILQTRALYRQSCGCLPRGNLEYTAITEDNKKLPASPEFYTDPGKRWFRLQDDLHKLRLYLSRLISVLSFSDLIEDLKKNFESFDIKSAAIILFGKEIKHHRHCHFALPDEAEVILHYDEKTKSGISRDVIHFNPRETLIPPGLFSDRRRTLVANSLYHREHQLGYIVFEMGSCDSSIYETLCVQLSTTIRSALVFAEKEAAEERLNEALYDLERSNKKLNDISRTDELTGLYNRRGFVSLGQQAIDLALRMNKNGLIVFGDMDGLKFINDTWGHEAGDRAIAAMAGVLRKTFRNMDVLSRLGGDEFAIVAVDITSDFIGTLRTRIEGLLNEYNSTSGESFILSISIGAVEFSGRENNQLEKLLSVADSLLYEEKRIKREKRQQKEGRV